jgi:hypothetical protein
MSPNLDLAVPKSWFDSIHYMKEPQRFNSIIHGTLMVIGLILLHGTVAVGQGIEDSGGNGWSVRIDGIQRTSGQIHLSFPILERRIYEVEHSADLTHWTAIHRFSEEFVEERAAVQLPLSHAESGFFRIRMLNAPPSEFFSEVYENYAEWREACLRLPFNRELVGLESVLDLLPLQTYAEFEEVLEAALRVYAHDALARPDAWVGQMPGQDTFFNLDAAYYLHPAIPFQPFAAKLRVAPGSRAVFSSRKSPTWAICRAGVFSTVSPPPKLSLRRPAIHPRDYGA